MTHALCSLAAGLTAALVLAGCPSPAPAPLPPAAAPEITAFTASPTEVEPGQTVTLSWTTQNAATVEIHDLAQGLVSGVSGESGSVEVTVTESAMFVLSARNSRGVRETAAAQVTVNDGAKGVLFAASPTQVAAGESAVLTWIAAGAREVSLQEVGGAQIDIGSQLDSGWVKVTPTLTTGYQLTVDGQTFEAQVAVTPVIELLQADPTSAVPGEPLTLQWLTRGADRVTVEAVGRGPVHETTTVGEAAEGSFTETLSAQLDPAQVVSYVVHAHGSNGAVASQKVELYVAGAPSVVAFEVPEFANEGLPFEMTWQTAGADEVEIHADGQPVYRSLTPAEAASGSLEWITPAQPVSFTLTAIYTRGGKSVSDAKVVTPVGIPEVLDFSATPVGGITNGGEQVTLNWNVPNATHVEIRQVGKLFHHVVSGAAASTGSVVVYPNENTTYELTADNGAGISVEPELLPYTVGAPAELVFGSAVPEGASLQLTGTTVPGVTMVHNLPAVLNLAGTQFEDIVGNGGVAANYSGPDTSAVLVTLPQPFAMPLLGEEVYGNQLSISINGWFAFRSSTFTGPDVATALPSTSLPGHSFAPLHEDLRDVNGEIYTRIDQANGAPRLIVQWNDVQIDLNGSAVAGSSLTFQAQLYADGRIVYAYQSLTGLTTQKPSIGVQNFAADGAATAPVVPSPGDTLSFFGSSTLPVTLIANDEPFSVIAELVDGDIEINGAMPILPAGQFSISEVNYNPATGEAEWFEVTNHTAATLDLENWVIDFGGGATHTVSGSLPLPPNGRVVLAQTGTVGTATVDYVYGPTFTLPDAAGSLSLSIAGAAYTAVAWTSAGTAGVALQADSPGTSLRVAGGLPTLTCPSTAPAYDSAGQLGTPGAPHPSCFGYSFQPSSPNVFTALGAAGTHLTSINSHDSYEALTLPRAVNLFGQPRTQLWVSSEGFVSVTAITQSHWSNASAVSNTAPNGVLAPFWDDLNPGTGQVRWQQFDPDATPASGDEYTVISWENWRAGSTGEINFQVRIDEASGDIDFLYGAMSGDAGRIAGNSATTWLKNEAGTAARAHNINSTTPGIAPNSGLRFTFTP